MAQHNHKLQLRTLASSGPQLQLQQLPANVNIDEKARCATQQQQQLPTATTTTTTPPYTPLHLTTPHPPKGGAITDNFHFNSPTGISHGYHTE